MHKVLNAHLEFLLHSSTRFDILTKINKGFRVRGITLCILEISPEVPYAKHPNNHPPFTSNLISSSFSSINNNLLLKCIVKSGVPQGSSIRDSCQ